MGIEVIAMAEVDGVTGALPRSVPLFGNRGLMTQAWRGPVSGQ
jgi:hypothetical protein